jgi:hypothetical protein
VADRGKRGAGAAVALPAGGLEPQELLLCLAVVAPVSQRELPSELALEVSPKPLEVPAVLGRESEVVAVLPRDQRRSLEAVELDRLAAERRRRALQGRIDRPVGGEQVEGEEST